MAYNIRALGIALHEDCDVGHPVATVDQTVDQGSYVGESVHTAVRVWLVRVGVDEVHLHVAGILRFAFARILHYVGIQGGERMFLTVHPKFASGHVEMC